MRITNFILFLFLALLPLGQILRFPVSLLGNKFSLNAADILAFSSLILAFFLKLKRPQFWKAATDFLLIAGFSLVFSLSFFELKEISLGIFYFIRLISYFFFFLLLWNLFRKQKQVKETAFKGLLLSSGFIAVFGWLQYLIYPDLRSLLYFNWDEHLLRMTGSFLDPTFTGILLVFGSVFSVFYFLKSKEIKRLLLILFFLTSLALTYSRASYLSLVVSFVTIFLLTKKFKEIVLLGIFFGLTVFFLPGGEGEGVKLERTASIKAKIQNYQDSVKLAKISPLFGLGFNNVCLTKKVYLNEIDTDSHACSGLDSSLLFLLVTTGITGVFSFMNLVPAVSRNLKKNSYAKILIVCFMALFVHSLFANSAFYSWVMGFMAVLLALSL